MDGWMEDSRGEAFFLLEVGFKVGAVKGCLSCDAPLKSPVNRPAGRLNPIGVQTVLEYTFLK